MFRENCSSRKTEFAIANKCGSKNAPASTVFVENIAEYYYPAINLQIFFLRIVIRVSHQIFVFFRKGFEKICFQGSMKQKEIVQTNLNIYLIPFRETYHRFRLLPAKFVLNFDEKVKKYIQYCGSYTVQYCG